MIVRGDVPAEVAKLKDKYAGEIQVHGSARLAQTLVPMGSSTSTGCSSNRWCSAPGSDRSNPAPRPPRCGWSTAGPWATARCWPLTSPPEKPTYGELKMKESFGLPDT
jgi:hypothetical protein